MPEIPNTTTLLISDNAGIPDGTKLDTPAGMPNVVLKTRPGGCGRSCGSRACMSSH